MKAVLPWIRNLAIVMMFAAGENRTQADVERYKDEAEYLARLAELGCETVAEDFEGGDWDGVR